jgi:hypothetical protein
VHNILKMQLNCTFDINLTMKMLNFSIQDFDDDGLEDPPYQHEIRYKRPRFTRAETEIYGTYTHTSMSLRAGDDLLQWACNQAFSYQDVRFNSMQSLAKAIRQEYTPHGVESIDFHEALDGNQYLWLHRRRMLPVLKSILKDPQFAGVQYTEFKLMRNENGCRIFGCFNAGQWYEFAHGVAQSKADHNEQVAVYPLIFSSDVTLGRKNLPLYPYIVAPGCIADDVRSEPGSWYLVAMFPHYNNDPAEKAGRVLNGPLGCRRRRVELHHLCLKVCMDDLNEISAQPIKMEWANGAILSTYIMTAAHVVDQSEQDLLCCEPSQRCKTCPCPRHLLHTPSPNLPPRRGRDVMKAVMNAAFKGILPGSLVRHRPLFRKGIDPSCGRERWFPTAECTTAKYEKVRKELGGVHMVENGLWEVRHYDYLVQAMKDSMHGQEHGTCDKILEGTVVVIGDLQHTLQLRGRQKDVLIKRLFRRLHQLCNSSKTQWVTLLRFSNQKLLVALGKHWQNYKKRQRGVAAEHSQPMCDANDVMKAMLAMPFALEGLAEKELNDFNSRIAGCRGRVKDPCRAMISTYNKYLHWYLMYRARHLTEDEITHMDGKGKELLDSLVSTFPHGVTLSDGTFRSLFCSEKPHSIIHAGRNYRFMGRPKNYNTVAPETRHKETKRKTHKTNNHCTVGKSILQSNMDVEAERHLSFLHDQRGGTHYIENIMLIVHTTQKNDTKCALCAHLL